jgi:hypothetical protein
VLGQNRQPPNFGSKLLPIGVEGSKAEETGTYTSVWGMQTLLLFVVVRLSSVPLSVRL